VEFDADWRWVDSLAINNGGAAATVPAYCELDVRLGWHPSEAIELSLAGQNLLHAQHPEYGAPGPTREKSSAASTRKSHGASDHRFPPRRVVENGARCSASSCAARPAAWSQIAAREYQVKAVFLFNFAQFVEWPPTAFPEATAPLVIGVLGADPFGAALTKPCAAKRSARAPAHHPALPARGGHRPMPHPFHQPVGGQHPGWILEALRDARPHPSPTRRASRSAA